jgi:Sec7-like guanine-nucleotide exchange factor
LSDSPPQAEKPEQRTQIEITTTNRYSGLPIDLTEETTGNTTSDIKKINKPPPIILYGIEDISKLTDLLNKTIPSDSYTYKIINKDQLRVMTQSTVIYKDLIELIRRNGLIGHTFTPKQNKCYRIVIKNLHHTTPKSAIVEKIEKQGT